MATLMVAEAACWGEGMHGGKGQQERIQRVPDMWVQGSRAGPGASGASIAPLSCFRKGMRDTGRAHKICICYQQGRNSI